MSRYKSKNGGTPEVHTARSKLDGVLQHLRDKTEESSQDDSFIKEESFDSDEYGSASPQVSPKKASTHSSHRHSYYFGKKSRKRQLDSPTLDLGPQYHHTYVMKLFDRSVDLAQFGESTSLYPVCRAWMKNQPHNRSLGVRERTPTPEPEAFVLPEDENDIQDVYQMPPTRYDKYSGRSGLPRIPSPLPQPGEKLNIHADPSEAAAPEHLLLDHLQRWRETRKRWKDHAQKLETTNEPGLKLLKTMFDRANHP